MYLMPITSDFNNCFLSIDSKNEQNVTQVALMAIFCRKFLQLLEFSPYSHGLWRPEASPPNPSGMYLLVPHFSNKKFLTLGLSNPLRKILVALQAIPVKQIKIKSEHFLRIALIQ